jgi:UTRA domain
MPRLVDPPSRPGPDALSEASPALSGESALLDIPSAATVVHLIHSACDQTGDILEVSESVWPADRIVVLDDYDLAQAPHDASVACRVPKRYISC